MQIIERKETPTLTVRYRTPVSELPNTMGAVYGEIAAYMGKSGIPFAGPPFIVYYNMDMYDLDVEVGFPLAKAAAGEGRIAASRLREGFFATAKHTGPYTTLEETYNALTAFIKEKGVQTETFMFEEYLNSPEDTPPENLETVIYFPIKKG
jgi:effector-binding domain-containing protein